MSSSFRTRFDEADPMPTYVILPVHESRAAKTRLATALSKNERVSLSLAMLSDVLDALRGTKTLERIVIVTRDIEVARVAKANGVRILWEGQSRGLNAAVMKGIRFAERECADRVLVVPADVPLAKPEDFTRILKTGRQNHVLIVPSHDRGGTNALLLSPPSIMPVSYGRNSFKRHYRLARKRSLRVGILNLPSLQLDVDTPADLRRIQLADGMTRSQRLLRTKRQVRRS